MDVFIPLKCAIAAVLLAAPLFVGDVVEPIIVASVLDSEMYVKTFETWEVTRKGRLQRRTHGPVRVATVGCAFNAEYMELQDTWRAWYTSHCCVFFHFLGT